ncbi:hypothetical protein [Pedobacter miscanthi]|uniref:hypothetical protein n=1 Tax=Pedobacter miscanthi TaxID=2259170 RepID=UPI00292F8090|nr:hypothetical protein [Pedobacter miscanthi]
MKYKITLILGLLTLTACTDESKCNRNFHDVLNVSTFQLWEKQTSLDINTSKNVKLMFLLKSEQKLGISIFHRQIFLKNGLHGIKDLENLKFDSLVIVEMNKSGEVNEEVKYIVASCSENTTIFKFELHRGKWKIDNIHEAKTKRINHVINILNHRTENDPYSGSGINDLVSISKFLTNDKITVKVLSYVDKEQFEALSSL